MNSGTQNRAINAMRAVAAVLVVASHVRALFFVDFAQSSGGHVTQLFYAVTGLGHQAVLVFFVLSGYWVGGGVIARMRTATFNWQEYGVSRLTRLWIVAIPALALTAVVDTVGRSAYAHSNIYAGSGAYHTVVPLDLSHVSTAAVAVGNVFFLQGIRVPTFGTDTALWSLAYEFWYYTIFAALCLALARWTAPKARSAAAVLAVASCLVAGIHVLALFLPWLLGAGIAYWREPIMRRVARPTRLRGVLQLGGATFCGACLLATRIVRGGEVELVVLSTLGSAVLLVTLLPDSGVGGTVGRGLNGVSWYAERSYSLYAIHLPLVALLAAAVVPSAAARWQLDGTHAAASVVVVLAVMAVAVLFAACTETRTDRVRRALMRKVPTRASVS